MVPSVVYAFSFVLFIPLVSVVGLFSYEHKNASHLLLVGGRAEIKKTVPHDSNIPEQLMVPYSIVKKYYNQNKKTFQELNQ